MKEIILFEEPDVIFDDMEYPYRIFAPSSSFENSLERATENDIYSKFQELKKKWIDETMFVSNPELIYRNKNYQAIIDLGEPVVPYLINELKMEDGNNDWLFALKEILQFDAIEEGHQGFFELMKRDWIKWANLKFGIEVWL